MFGQQGVVISLVFDQEVYFIFHFCVALKVVYILNMAELFWCELALDFDQPCIQNNKNTHRAPFSMGFKTQEKKHLVLFFHQSVEVRGHYVRRNVFLQELIPLTSKGMKMN